MCDVTNGVMEHAMVIISNRAWFTHLYCLFVDSPHLLGTRIMSPTKLDLSDVSRYRLQAHPSNLHAPLLIIK